MDDTAQNLNDYTVVELKAFLHNLGLKTSGLKAELIQQLTATNIQTNRNASYTLVINQDLVYNENENQENDEEEATNVQPLRTTHCETIPQKVLKSAQREMDLLRRERDLLERELRLVRYDAK